MPAETSAQRLRTAERRQFVLQMRKAGATYREIAAAAERHFASESDILPKHWDELYAYKDVKRTLDQMRHQMAEDVENIRALELERLDDMLKVLYGYVMPQRNQPPPDASTRFKAIDRILRLMDARRRLVPSLDQPMPISGPEGGAILVKTIGANLDEL